MTEQEIVQLARDAGIESNASGDYPLNSDAFVADVAAMVRFATLVAEREREACAKVAAVTICDTHMPTGINIYGTRVAAAISARGLK